MSAADERDSSGAGLRQLITRISHDAAADPMAIHAEQAALGAAMTWETAAEHVVGELVPDDYLRPGHAHVHRAIKTLLAAGETVDPVTVAASLGATRLLPEERDARRSPTLLEVVGGGAYLHTLQSCATTAAHVERQVREITDAARRRRVVETLLSGAQRAAATDVDVQDLLHDVRGDLGWLAWRADSSWPEPAPLAPRLPELPAGALPGIAGQMVAAVAEATQTAPDLAAMAALATLSAASRGAWEVVARPGWVEQTALYTVGLANSGERKSAVVRAITSALADAERAVRDDGREQHAGDAMAYRVMEKRVKAAEDHAAKAGPGAEYIEALAEAADLAAQLAAMSPPSEFRVLVGDTTPEALGELMADQGGPMAVLSAEGGLLGTLAGRYAKTGAANVDLVLQSYDGERVLVDRVQRGSLVIDRPFLAMGLVVQPDVLAEALKVQAFTERGLLPRMLFAWPTTMLGSRDLDAPSVPAELAAAWSETVSALLNAGRAALAETGRPHRIHLDDEATALLDEFRAAHEARLHPDTGDLGNILAWASKLPGALVRVAALLTLARTAGEDPRVKGPDMASALGLADYLIAHARETLAGGKGERGRLAAVLAWVRGLTREGADRPAVPAIVTFSEREAWRALHGQTWAQTSADVASALGDLVDLGYLRRLPPPAKPAKGRPAGPSYEVNPRIREIRRGR